MGLEKIKINLKVFLLEKTYYEFKDKSPKEIIEIIKQNHIRKLNSQFDDLSSLNISLTSTNDGEFELWSYCYNQPKNQFYWKLFLPDSLSENQNFEIIEFSYVLFINYRGDIYCVIGGSGMSVIKKFIDTNFGIDLYQHFAKPTEDVIIEMNSRGIASNISQKKHTFNLDQTISETLEYSEIPTKIKLLVRDELKENLFSKYDLDKDRALLEVGSYFNLRKKIDFEQLKGLVKDIHEIRNNGEYSQLTLFRKMKNEKLLYELDEYLKEKIVDDIISNNSNLQQREIIEVVHPTKLERFYECNKFVIKAKYSRGKNDAIINDRTKLYDECVKFIFKHTKDINDRFEIKGNLYTLNIIGYIDDKEITYANFYSHLTSEIEFLGKKYFRIDGNWYYLQDEFLKLMNDDAIEYYQKYHLKEKILNQWSVDMDEDFYNKSHNDENYFVLDKVIKENIEICDILVFKDGKVYFIHVKNGFDAKMRDLYIQMILSAKRLSNDLKNNNGSSYLEKTLEYYNNKNPQKIIDISQIINDISSKKLSIVFVMAFNNTYYKGMSIPDKMRSSKSNIAKYSVVQTVKEIQQYFDVKLIDISEL